MLATPSPLHNVCVGIERLAQHPSVCLSLSMYLSVCLSVCLAACLPACLPLSLFDYLSIYLFIYLFISVNVLTIRKYAVMQLRTFYIQHFS